MSLKGEHNKFVRNRAVCIGKVQHEYAEISFPFTCFPDELCHPVRVLLTWFSHPYKFLLYLRRHQIAQMKF